MAPWWEANSKEAYNCGLDGLARALVLPRIGRVRTHESTRKLARRLQAGTARNLSVPIDVQVTPDYDHATPIGETLTHEGIY